MTAPPARPTRRPATTTATRRPTETSLPTATRLPTTGPAVTPTPSSTATTVSARPAPTVVFRVEQIQLMTYPYAGFLTETTDPSLGDYPLLTLDRGAYGGSNPGPAPVTYDLLVLENAYLRVGILPALGGRVYECVFKPTGHNEFYQNPVIKPTNWGPPASQYPAGANWWLAAGGLEWGFPVEEHGYEWGRAWSYASARLPDGSATVTLTSGSPERPHVAVTISLAPARASFTVSPRVVNGSGSTFRFKWWDNAMLAPGGANSPGPDLHFILPAGLVTVHSSGDERLPGPGAAMAWPVYGGRDMSRLGNWREWLGAFARPAAAAGYMGVYDTAADEGMLRIFPAGTARGAKIFAMGWESPIDWHEWTDDGSGYVELHGGLAPTFDDWVELPAGGSITWTEEWYPAAGIGHVSYAASAGAVNLRLDGTTLRVGLHVTGPVQGRLVVDVAGGTLVDETVDLAPDRPYYREASLEGAGAPAWGDVAVRLLDDGGRVVLEYGESMQLQPPR